MWKFQDFSCTQILREINFGYFDVQKVPFLPFEQLQTLQFLGTFDIVKYEIFQKLKFKASKIVKMAVFDLLKSAKIDLT